MQLPAPPGPGYFLFQTPFSTQSKWKYVLRASPVLVALLKFPVSPCSRAVVIVVMMGSVSCHTAAPFQTPVSSRFVWDIGNIHSLMVLRDKNWIKTHHRFQILGSNSHISTEIPSTPFRYQSDRIYPDFWNVPHSSISTSSGLQIPQLQLYPESRVPYSQCHLPVCFPELLCAFLCIQPSTKGRGRKRKEG